MVGTVVSRKVSSPYNLVDVSINSNASICARVRSNVGLPKKGDKVLLIEVQDEPNWYVLYSLNGKHDSHFVVLNDMEKGEQVFLCPRVHSLSHTRLPSDTVRKLLTGLYAPSLWGISDPAKEVKQIEGELSF